MHSSRQNVVISSVQYHFRSAGDERFDVRKIGISTIKNLLR